MLSAEELYEKWRPQIRLWILKHQIRPDDVDDVEAEVYRDFIAKGWPERIDVEVPAGKKKASHRHWLYQFVRHTALHFLGRCSRNPLRLRVGPENEQFLVESNTVTQPESRAIEFGELVTVLQRRLASEPVRSVVEGTSIERSLRIVMGYLIDEWKQAEIARELRCSSASICLMVKAIRKIAGELRLREEL